MSAREFFVYGERCSGTNYVTALLERNLVGVRPGSPRVFGWKHRFLKRNIVVAPESVLILMTRNPYDWIRSLHKKPHHAHPDLRKLDFPTFIRAPWRAVTHAGVEMKQELKSRDGKPFANALQLRTAKLSALLKFSEVRTNVIVIRYEDAAKDPEGVVTSIGKRFSLSRTPAFTPVDEYQGKKKASKYTKATYPYIPVADMAHILQNLSHPLESALGY